MPTGQNWKPGDWAIYVKQKRSVSPGPRARHVVPATSGDSYSYLVEKCWIVHSVKAVEQQLVLITRTGKRHTIDFGDPRLKKPTLWQRLTLRGRFQRIEQVQKDLQKSSEE